MLSSAAMERRDRERERSEVDALLICMGRAVVLVIDRKRRAEKKTVTEWMKGETGRKGERDLEKGKPEVKRVRLAVVLLPGMCTAQCSRRSE